MNVTSVFYARLFTTEVDREQNITDRTD